MSDGKGLPFVTTSGEVSRREKISLRGPTQSRISPSILQYSKMIRARRGTVATLKSGHAQKWTRTVAGWAHMVAVVQMMVAVQMVVGVRMVVVGLGPRASFVARAVDIALCLHEMPQPQPQFITSET